MKKHRSEWLPGAVSLLVWGIVLSSAVYRYTNIFGLCGVVAGVVCASLLQAFLGGRYSRRVLLLILGSGVLSIGLGWALQHTAWPEIDVQMRIFQMVVFFGIALMFVVAFSYLATRWPGWRYVEAAVLVVMSSNLVSAHRHGLIQRPFWFYDIFVERGIPSSVILEGFSLLIFLLVCVRLAIGFPASSAPSADRRHRPRVGPRILAEIIFLWLFCATVAHVVPPPAMGVSMAPPPPAAPDGPPPPPPPRNIALVKFQGFNMPPARLGAYYFRAQPHDERQIRPIQDKVSASDGEVTTTVHMFAEGDKVPLLSNFERATKNESATTPFSSSYTVLSKPIGSTGMKDVDLAYDLGDLGQKFTSDTWNDTVKQRWLDYGNDAGLRALVQEILQGQSEAKPTPEYIIVRVREWLGKKCSLSQKRSAEIKDGDLTSFLYGDHIGGTKEFAEAFVRMLRAAGVPARRASGYVFPLQDGNVAGQNFKEAILVTDQHIEQWAEIHLENSGWLPVPIIYENIIDKPDPPPQQDLEDLLANMTPKGGAQPVASPRMSYSKGLIRRVLIGLACFAAIALALSLVAYPIFAGVIERTGERLLRFSVRLLHNLRYSRRFGESWEAFAMRLHQRLPRTGKAFAQLIAIRKQFVYDRTEQISRAQWICTYFKMLGGLIVDPVSVFLREILSANLRQSRKPR